jgi:hypothetical protein
MLFLTTHRHKVRCVSQAIISALQCVHLGSHNTHPHSNQTVPGLVQPVRCNGLQCIRYPITKFLDARVQWWHINAVFNEPPTKEIAWCEIRRMGCPREKVVVLSLNTSKRSTQKDFSCYDAVLGSAPAVPQ